MLSQLSYIPTIRALGGARCMNLGNMSRAVKRGAPCFPMGRIRCGCPGSVSAGAGAETRGVVARSVDGMEVKNRKDSRQRLGRRREEE